MIVLDFLVYYTNAWFENNRKKLAWSTPLERTCYVIGIALSCFLLTIQQLYQYVILKNVIYIIPKIILIIFALGIIQLISYIYITKDRFRKVELNKFDVLGKISENARTIFTMAFLFISLMSPFFILLFFIPFSHQKN